VYNINAGTAASEIADALGADIPALRASGIISGGMLPKIEACTGAVENGGNNAVIIDGRIEHSILLELFSDGGIGWRGSCHSARSRGIPSRNRNGKRNNCQPSFRAQSRNPGAESNKKTTIFLQKWNNKWILKR
jgi:hypothetical protein